VTEKLGLLSIERHFKDIGKNAIVSELILLKQESACSSLVDIMTLTTLADVARLWFVQCKLKWEVECKTVVCGHWKSQMNGVIIA